jgi:outer membrane protein
MTRVMMTTVLSALIAVGTAAAQTPQTRPTTPVRPAAPPAAPAPAAPAPVAAAPAVPVPFPADAKIGFVNMQTIVSQSKLGKSGQDRMKELNDRKSAELATQNKQVQSLQAEIQAGQAVLSANVLAQKNAELDRLTRETQFKQEQAQADVQALNDQLLDEFSAKVLPIVEQLRAEKGLWVVFALGDGTGVAAVHQGLDLSAEVIKRLDAVK